MPDAHTFVLFGVASLALLIVPGPAVLYIVTRSVADGRRAGVVSMLGIEAGGLIHVAAAALGVSALLASSATALATVKYLGAAYLIYLGIRQLRRPVTDVKAVAVERVSGPRLFLHGALVQILNPKVALFFLAFLPQFVDPARGTVTLQVIALGVAFTLLALLSDGCYALTVGTAANWVGARTSRWRRVAKLGGGVYIALGLLAALSVTRPSAANPTS